MARKFIVKKDNEVALETESEAKAERLYEKLISDRKRYDSVELVYPSSVTDAPVEGGV